MCTTLLALGLAKQSRWRPVKNSSKRSPDGFGFGGHHHISHGGSGGAPSGYGAPRAAPSAPAVSAQAGYGQPRAPACTTEYEEECTTVNEEQCQTVNDNVCSATTRHQVNIRLYLVKRKSDSEDDLCLVPDCLRHQVQRQLQSKL